MHVILYGYVKVGPAAINYGETLSTLLFATRCMAVKTTPIQHEEVNYAELCARLQVTNLNIFDFFTILQRRW